MELFEPGYQKAFLILKYLLAVFVTMNIIFIYSFPKFAIHLKILLIL